MVNAQVSRLRLVGRGSAHIDPATNTEAGSLTVRGGGPSRSVEGQGPRLEVRESAHIGSANNTEAVSMMVRGLQPLAYTLQAIV